MLLTNICILILGILSIYAGWNVIIRKNTMQSWFALLLVFLFSGILFLSLGAEFIAVIWLIVYFGAIAVLFLFIIMMLTLQRQVKTSFNFEKKIAYIIIIGLLALFIGTWFISGQGIINDLFFSYQNNENFISSLRIFDSIVNPVNVELSHFENVLTLENGINKNSFFFNNDIKIYSVLLYDTFGPCVIVAGMLLFVAMIGAVFLTKKAANKNLRT